MIMNQKHTHINLHLQQTTSTFFSNSAMTNQHFSTATIDNQTYNHECSNTCINFKRNIFSVMTKRYHGLGDFRGVRDRLLVDLGFLLALRPFLPRRASENTGSFTSSGASSHSSSAGAACLVLPAAVGPCLAVVCRWYRPRSPPGRQANGPSRLHS